MLEYPIYELSESEFEKLTNTVCQKILGTGVISFTKGKDGGKDGRFNGIAEKFPSTSSPWSGKFIIQAKHTNNSNASVSNSDFKTIIKKETKRVIIIRDSEGLDNYLIFTNRRHTGIVGDALIKKMKSDINLQNIEIIGLETLTLLLRQNQSIVDNFDLENLKNPLRIFPDDIKEVFLALVEAKDNIDPTEIKNPFEHVDIETKNQINKMNQEYFEFIKDGSQAYFNQISIFLGDPKNKEFLEKYQDIVSDLQGKITTYRNRFSEFNEIIEYYYDFIIRKCPEIQKNKRLIRVLLHFMYWSCDIGKKENDKTE